MLAQTHLAEIKARLSSSPIVETISVSVEHAGQGYGKLKKRLGRQEKGCPVRWVPDQGNTGPGYS